MGYAGTVLKNKSEYAAIVYTLGSKIYAEKYNGEILDSEVFNTDDARVLQSAFDYLSDLGGGVISIRQATYIVNTTLLIPAFTVVKGSGWNTIIQLQNSANVDVIRNKNWNVSSDEGIIIKDICIDGNKANQSSSTIDCISFNKALRYRLDTCLIKNAKRFGIRTTGNGVGVTFACKINGNGSTGISVAVSSDDSHFIANDIGSNGGAGINLNGVANCSITNNNIYLNTLQGIDISSASKNSINANNIHDNIQSGIRVTASSTNNSADGNQIVGNTVHDNNTGNSSTFAEILLTASAGIALEQTVVSSNYITVTGSNNTGIKESIGSINNSNIALNNMKVSSGSAIVTIGSTTKVYRNNGYTTENKVNGSALALDSTSEQTITFNHGLNYTPDIKECRLQLNTPNNSITDFVIAYMYVATVTSTQVTAKAKLSTASVTAGSNMTVTLTVAKI